MAGSAPMRQVVGAAIVRHGCVLAARRTTPPEAAGRWEFPGGKVEAGESSEQAIVREVAEELGCSVTLTGWLAGSAAIGTAHELTVGLAELVGGDPQPVEHDQLRWLPPEQLDDVDWLEPDRPFLPELRERLLDGERLPGGNVGGAVRIGETVRRPTGPWTPAVHRLLAHLSGTGVPGVPTVHGIDARGREVLDLISGDVVDIDGDRVSDAQLASLGRWTRQLHDAVEGWDDPGPWRFFGVDRPMLVAHNDLGPYNVCFTGDQVAGVFDWDLAGPSTPLMELAHIAWNAVPLFRPIDLHEAARRLTVLATAYDGPSPRAILDAVPDRVQLAVDGIRKAAADGDQGMQALRASGEPERSEQRLAAHLSRATALVGILDA